MKRPKQNNQRCVTGVQRKPLPKGTVLVHNHIQPQRKFGMNGFRVWTQTLTDKLEVCDCEFAGLDLGGLIQYRVRLELKP